MHIKLNLQPLVGDIVSCTAIFTYLLFLNFFLLCSTCVWCYRVNDIRLWPSCEQ